MREGKVDRENCLSCSSGVKRTEPAQSDESSGRVELDNDWIELSAHFVETERDSSESTGEKKVCRVGSKVNRVEEGELLCISSGEVAECSSRETDCASSKRVPLRQVTATHVCLPADSKSLETVRRKYQLSEKLEDLNEKRDSLDLSEFLRALEKSPRSHRKQIRVDSC